MTNQPTLHSHTHCQVAQADPQTKTWQRVCLSNRNKDSETHDRQEGQQLTLSGLKKPNHKREVP